MLCREEDCGQHSARPGRVVAMAANAAAITIPPAAAATAAAAAAANSISSATAHR